MDTAYVPSTQALMTPLSTVKQEDVSSPNSESLITQKDGELERPSYRWVAETPSPRRTAMNKPQYPHKSCQKRAFFKGKGWSNEPQSDDDRRYRCMKKFGKAAVITIYNAQTRNTRKAWKKPEVQGWIQKSLYRLLKDLHPDPECRELLAETDKYVLKHIVCHVLQEFRSVTYKKYSASKNYQDLPEMGISGEYEHSLKDWMACLASADLETRVDVTATDDHIDLTTNANENDHNESFHPNTEAIATSPDSYYIDLTVNADESDYNHVQDPSTRAVVANPSLCSMIEDGNAKGRLNLMPAYHASKNSCSSSLPPKNAAIESNPNTTGILHDIRLSICPSGAQLSNSRKISHASTSSFRDSAPRIAINDTGNSTAVEDKAKSSSSKIASRQKSVIHREIESVTHYQRHHDDASVLQPFSRYTVPDEETTIIRDSSTIPEQNIVPSSNADAIDNHLVKQESSTFPIDLDLNNTKGNGSPTDLIHHRLLPTSDSHSAHSGMKQQQMSPHRQDEALVNPNASLTSTYDGHIARNYVNQQQSSPQPYNPCDRYSKNLANFNPSPTSTHGGHPHNRTVISSKYNNMPL